MTEPDDEAFVLSAVANWRCPFCGGTNVYARMTHLPPKMSGPGALVSCELSHECMGQTLGVLNATRRVRARDVPTCIAEWMREGDHV